MTVSIDDFWKGDPYIIVTRNERTKKLEPQDVEERINDIEKRVQWIEDLLQYSVNETKSHITFGAKK